MGGDHDPARGRLGALRLGRGFDIRILLPLVVLSFQPIALIVRQTRAAVIEVLSEDFVRTAGPRACRSWWWRCATSSGRVLTPVVTQLGSS